MDDKYVGYRIVTLMIVYHICHQHWCGPDFTKIPVFIFEFLLDDLWNRIIFKLSIFERFKKKYVEMSSSILIILKIKILIQCIDSTWKYLKILNLDHFVISIWPQVRLRNNYITIRIIWYDFLRLVLIWMISHNAITIGIRWRTQSFYEPFKLHLVLVQIPYLKYVVIFQFRRWTWISYDLYHFN